MESIGTPSSESLMKLRHWRSRRGYQRLRNGVETTKKSKFRLARLWRIRRRTVVKLRWKMVSSPLKLLAKFHDAYVEVMMRLANGVGNMYSIGAFGGGKREISKGKKISVVSCGEEVLDTNLVLEIYKKIAASKNLAAAF